MIRHPPNSISWSRFFKRLNFFSFFHHFVRIDIVANSVEGNNDNYLEWVGFVESKMFILLNLLAENQHIQQIRAYPTNFKNKELAELGLMDAEIGKYQYVETYFLGFQLYMQEPQPQQLVVDLQDAVISFC